MAPTDRCTAAYCQEAGGTESQGKDCPSTFLSSTHDSPWKHTEQWETAAFMNDFSGAH